ncbi:MAG: branched-chain amino acid transporter permease [Anaerovoracaceae bacterium]
MTISPTYAIIIILIVAVFTFITRAFPFVLFGRHKDLPVMVKYLGNILPPAVIAILVIYALRNMNFTEPANFLPQIIAVIVVATLHFWKRNNLLSIGCGTALYMILIQIIFI